MKKNYLSVITDLNAMSRVKIRYDVIKSGYSLYLEYVHDKRRERKRLGIVLTLRPEFAHREAEAMRRVVAMRDEAERMVMSDSTIRVPVSHVSFSVYSARICAQKKPVNREGYSAASAHFIRTVGDMPLSAVTGYHVQRYRQSLSDRSPNTRNHYVAALRHVYDCAIREGYVKSNPFRGIPKERVVPAREYLSESDIRALIDTPCDIQAVKDAFLFSCFTGLRWGDLAALTRSNLRDEYLVYTQRKTGIPGRILLPAPVRDLVSSGDRLFPLPSYDVMRRVLPQWISAAGITKVITFHCARHTFATLQISLGTDIYVLSKMLGHSDVRTTQIYAKMVDQRRDDAMNVLASLFSSE